MASNSYTLRCVILNEPPGLPSVLKVVIPVGSEVDDLKKAIKTETENDLKQYDAHTLVLWKVNL
jgi:hypothetical protein